MAVAVVRGDTSELGITEAIKDVAIATTGASVDERGVVWHYCSALDADPLRVAALLEEYAAGLEE